MHVCTWKHCGAPATKMLRLRLRHPERIMDERGKPIPDAGRGRDMWRCDPHYMEEVERWKDTEFFIVEF